MSALISAVVCFTAIHVLRTTYSRWEALLKCSPYGEATVVEVPDELWVNGAAELSHLPVSRSDEDALDGLHENVVEQGVLCP